MTSKIRLVAVLSAAGAFLAACHGSFYGGGDLGVSYVSPVRHDAAAATTASMVPSTTAPPGVAGAATAANRL